MPNFHSTLPIQPSPRKTNGVPAWLVGFVLLASFSFTPVAFAQTVVKQVAAAESQPKVIPFPLLDGRTGVPSVLEAPRHGSLEVGNGQFVYTPEAGYMGRDSFQIDFPAANGSHLVMLYQVRVLPRFIPLQGALPKPQSPALYDSWSRSFILCEPVNPTGGTLDCGRVPTKGLPPANYFPLVLPADSDMDQLALYDDEKGLLHFLDFEGSELEAREAISLAPMKGGWPLVGDWEASGKMELAMVFDDGRVYVLGPSSWELWPQRFNIPSEDPTLWPVAENIPGQPSRMVYVSPIQGRLDWLTCDRGKSCTSGYKKSFARFDFRRTLGGEGVRFLLDVDASLQLVVGKFSPEDPSPHTIPVKFPDDPINGGG